MHLAAQYLRVVLLFFSYSDKRFWCFSSLLRLDSRNLSSLPVRHQPSLISLFFFFFGHSDKMHWVFFFLSELPPSISLVLPMYLWLVFFRQRTHSYFEPFFLSHSYSFEQRKRKQGSQIQNRTLPLCALCKRDILLRILDGATTPLLHCTVIWTA